MGDRPVTAPAWLIAFGRWLKRIPLVGWLVLAVGVLALLLARAWRRTTEADARARVAQSALGAERDLGRATAEASASAAGEKNAARAEHVAEVEAARAKHRVVVEAARAEHAEAKARAAADHAAEMARLDEREAELRQAEAEALSREADRLFGPRR